MRTLKRVCIVCGDGFSLSRSEMSLLNMGEIGPEDIKICDECADRVAEAYDYSYEMYSDADNGL
jgi:hypothetical protein